MVFEDLALPPSFKLKQHTYSPLFGLKNHSYPITNVTMGLVDVTNNDINEKINVDNQS